VPLPRRTGRASGLLTVSLLANLGLAGWVGYTAFTKPPPPAVGGPLPPLPEPGDIGALGRVQPAAGVLNVFGPPGDRLTELKVAVGDKVAVGQPLGTLAGDADRQLAVEAADKQLAEAEALRASIGRAKDAKLKDADFEFAAADAKLAADLAGLEAKGRVLAAQGGRAETELARLRSSRAGGLPVAEQDLLAAETAAVQVREERAAVDTQRTLLADQRAKAKDSLAAKKELIAAEADRAAAQVPTSSLAAARQAAERKRDESRLVARRPGRVVKLLAHPGDTLGTTPVLQTADAAGLTVLAEVYETDVARLRGWLAAGKPVAAEIDGRVLKLPEGSLRGTVAPGGVAPTIARNQVFALGPREDADRRVVEVTVTLDPAAAARLADYLGLQVRVRLVKPGG
jgi:HlyD family secretion protein